MPNATQPMPRNLTADHYVDRHAFEAERKRVFWRTWQLVGNTQQLIKPGSYIATDIAGAGVIVVRDTKHTLRGFRNLCRHRGARLLERGEGQVRSIHCPYHQWVYGLDGALRRAPHFGDDDAIDLDEWPLLPVSVCDWRGLVFAALAPQQSLAAQLGATVAEMAEEPMETSCLVETRRLRFAANWKIYTDNFVEGYHIPGIHPAFFKAIEFSQFRTEAEDGLVRMSAPTAGELFYRGRWLWMWPNWTLSLYPGGFNTSRINAVSESETELLYHFYFQDADDSARATQLETVEKNMDVIREDFSICEEIHQNFVAGGYTPGPLSPLHERGVAYFQQRLREALQA